MSNLVTLKTTCFMSACIYPVAVACHVKANKRLRSDSSNLFSGNPPSTCQLFICTYSSCNARFDPGILLITGIIDPAAHSLLLRICLFPWIQMSILLKYTYCLFAPSINFNWLFMSHSCLLTAKYVCEISHGQQSCYSCGRYLDWVTNEMVFSFYSSFLKFGHFSIPWVRWSTDRLTSKRRVILWIVPLGRDR